MINPMNVSARQKSDKAAQETFCENFTKNEMRIDPT